VSEGEDADIRIEPMQPLPRGPGAPPKPHRGQAGQHAGPPLARHRPPPRRPQ
jgi:hypothetical protein